MRIESYNSDYFEIVPESNAEQSRIENLPLALRSAGKFFISKKPNVLQNVIPRIKKVHPKPIKVDREVLDLMQDPLELLEIPTDFKWITTPYPHQHLCLRFLYTYGSGGLLLEPGLGKTFIVLNYIKLANFSKSLIVCPKALCFVWEDEVAEHRPDLTVHVMESTSWDSQILNAHTRLGKWGRVCSELSKEPSTEELTKKLTNAKANYRKAERDLISLPKRMQKDLSNAEAADIVVINYEKAVPGEDWLLKQKFDFMAIDEGLIKDVTTKRTKCLTKLSVNIPYKTIMSGTLINNGPLDAFSPVKILEPSLVSTAYGRFEHRYAKMAETVDGRRFVAGVSKANTLEIRDILRSCSIVMTKEEWLDLPGKVFHNIVVPLTVDQQRIYDELSANHICNIDGRFVEVDNPLTLAGKLNQVANGFIYTYDDEEDSLASLFGDTSDRNMSDRDTIFIDSPKRHYLKDLILNTISDKKFILWYNLSAEYEQIVEVLDSIGIKYESIRGGHKDTGTTVRKFNKSTTVQVLVCQSQSVNYGITVLGSSPETLDTLPDVLPDFSTEVYTQVFWSVPWSLERYTQMQDRCHRIGQTHEVHYYLLITNCPIEMLVLDRLKDKKDIRESILVDIASIQQPKPLLL